MSCNCPTLLVLTDSEEFQTSSKVLSWIVQLIAECVFELALRVAPWQVAVFDHRADDLCTDPGFSCSAERDRCHPEQVTRSNVIVPFERVVQCTPTSEQGGPQIARPSGDVQDQSHEQLIDQVRGRNRVRPFGSIR
jgi:hypothetical protein